MARRPGKRRLTTADDLPLPVTPLSDSSPESDMEDDESETGPLRRCVVSRERLPKERMIRFVVGPDRALVPDLAARLPGRGIWLSARRDVLQAATSRGAFAKAARGPVNVPPELSALLQAALARRVGEILGLARRAGQAVCGFQKAREMLVAGKAGAAVEASDGSPEEIARFLGGHAAHIPVVQPLDAETLGAIFGRDRVVHVIVAKGRLADMVADEASRLAGLSAEIAQDTLKRGSARKLNETRQAGR